MSNEFLLMIHPSLGVLGVLAATWVFVDTLNARPETLGRIRLASYASAVLIWGSYLVGGYWYVTLYAADRELVKAGPWPFAHSFFLESKEHVFLSLLLLATFLPISASGDLAASRGARNLVLWSALFVVGLGLAMEGAGAVVAMGVKVAALAR